MANINNKLHRGLNNDVEEREELYVKNNGIIRKIDALGRLVIPKEMRKVLKMNVGDDIEIHSMSNSVMLIKHTSKCIYCGNENDLVEFKGTSICRKCIHEVSKKLSGNTQD